MSDFKRTFVFNRCTVISFFIGFLAIASSELMASHTFFLSAEEYTILPVPFSLDLEGISVPENHEPHLYRLNKDQEISLPSQIESGRTKRLWFILDKEIHQGTKAKFQLTFEEITEQKSQLNTVVDNKTITLKHQGKTILSYHHAVHPVPEGVNQIFERSGFIHPLITPNGMTVTRIQPLDHYHHYGIWSPCSKARIEEHEVDFWNLARGEGRVRFAGLLSTISGPVYAGFRVHHEHVMYEGQEKLERVAINEVWHIRASAVNIDGQTVWIVDYTSILNNATGNVIELPTHRYGGGLGFRATDAWNKDNLVVLSSEGKTRNESDGTRARWADLRGVGLNNAGMAGVLFLSHPENWQHPEPLRVWPDTAEEGLLFFNFCPIRFEVWALKPNQEHVLRYRIVVYDGSISPEIAEALWKNFARPSIPIKSN